MKYFLSFAAVVLSQTSITYACSPALTQSGLIMRLFNMAFIILLPVTVLLVMVLLITYVHKKKVFKKMSKNPTEDIFKIKKKYTLITLVLLLILIIIFLVPIIGYSVFEVEDYYYGGCEKGWGTYPDFIIEPTD